MMKMPLIASKKYSTQTRWIFHCHCKIKIPLDSDTSLLDECFSLLETIDRQYNSYQMGSYFDQINKGAGTWVTVDAICIQLLHTLKLISTLTEGSYDITCMPLMRLWGFYRDTHHTFPTLAELQHVRKKVDYRSICIKDNQVKINAGQEIITGSFIKAFAVDQVIGYLREKGVTDAVINAGGSTIAAINDTSHPYWNINIPDPTLPGIFVETRPIHNQCFSLSGKLNNNVLIDNKQYSHILNSQTGLPASSLQVGVISDNAFIGDILSTAIYTVQDEDLQNTINRLKEHFDFQYFRIAENGNKTIG